MLATNPRSFLAHRDDRGKRLLMAALAVTLVSLFSPIASVRAQGVLVNVNPDEQVRLPRPIPGPSPARDANYRITELDVHVRLLEEIARVQVSQSFQNTGSQPMEVAFVFPLPYDGAIDQLTLLVDGKEFAATLLSKDEARRRYEEIVRKNRDPALLEWLGTGMFQTSVFPVPPGATREVQLRYTQLCQRRDGLTDFIFPLATAKYTSKPIERLNFDIAIETKGELKNVYSPTHSLEVERQAHTATAKFTAKDVLPSTDFRMFYGVQPGTLGASLLSFRGDEKEDGYFVLLASPRIETESQESARKSIVFVVDRSGSMSGEKIEQAKGALRFVLNNLREGDLFNIVAYDSTVETFRPELQKFNDETRDAALAFANGLYSGGSTNIGEALRTSLSMLTDASMPSYVLFLTDGLPTEGETNESKLVEISRETNDVRARVVAFGVGYDVNSRLLDRVARENHGQTEYVRPDENIEDRVSRLYRRIQSPVLSDARIELVATGGEDSGANRVYPKNGFDLFAGESLVLVGRYRAGGAAQVVVRGTIDGEERTFEFPVELAKNDSGESYAFTEKLWAIRRIGEIIDELDLKGQNQELVDELVALSTRHGILTPYTSFLADETTNLGDLAANRGRAAQELEMLEESSGISGFAQRSIKSFFRQSDQAAPAAMPAESMGRGIGQNTRSVTGFAIDEALSDERRLESNVWNQGSKTFFRRGEQWIDSTLGEDEQKNAIRVAQFSDDYFELVERHGHELSQYLTNDGAVLLSLDGQAYLIEPDAN